MAMPTNPVQPKRPEPFLLLEVEFDDIEEFVNEVLEMRVL
jgi:hypothetical protein